MALLLELQFVWHSKVCEGNAELCKFYFQSFRTTMSPLIGAGLGSTSGTGRQEHFHTRPIDVIILTAS